jgi:hypothetical protein
MHARTPLDVRENKNKGNGKGKEKKKKVFRPCPPDGMYVQVPTHLQTEKKQSGKRRNAAKKQHPRKRKEGKKKKKRSLQYNPTVAPTTLPSPTHSVIFSLCVSATSLATSIRPAARQARPASQPASLSIAITPAWARPSSGAAIYPPIRPSIHPSTLTYHVTPRTTVRDGTLQRVVRLRDAYLSSGRPALRKTVTYGDASTGCRFGATKLDSATAARGCWPAGGWMDGWMDAGGRWARRALEHALPTHRTISNIKPKKKKNRKKPKSVLPLCTTPHMSEGND